MEVIERESLDVLFDALRRRGFKVVGPTVRDQAIVYDEISSTRGPARRLDRRAGRRHLPAAAPSTTRRCSATRSARTRGSTSCTRRGDRLWQGPRATTAGFEVTEEPDDPPRYAFIGVRSCDLHAIATQDTVLMEGAHPDPATTSPPRGRVHRRVN